MSITDSEKLPIGWAYTTLGQIQLDLSKGIYPSRTPEDMFELYSVPSHEYGVPEVVKGKYIGSNKQIVEPNTVLLCKINPRINRVWIVDDYSKFIKIASTEWIPFFQLSCVEPRFLSFFLQQNAIRDFLAGNASGVGGSLMRIRAATFRDFSFPIAPIQEQIRIADALDELFSDLDAGVAALMRAKEKLKLYRASVLKAAVEGALTAEGREQRPHAESASELLKRILVERRQRWEEDQLRKFKEKGQELPKNWKGKYKEPVAPDTDKLPPLPEGWCWATVEQLASSEKNSITDGPFGSNLKTDHYTDIGPRVIRLQNIKDGVFADERAYISKDHFDKLEKHQVLAGDLVIAALGDNPPRSCIVPESVGPAIVKADCIRFKTSGMISGKCINVFLNSMPTRERTKKRVHGVGRPRMNLEEIKSIVLPLPSFLEQEAIVEIVEDQLSVIDHLEAELDTKLKSSQALRQSILRHAFTGRLVPQDPDDEPATELLKRIAAEREERSREAAAAKQVKNKKTNGSQHGQPRKLKGKGKKED